MRKLSVLLIAVLFVLPLRAEQPEGLVSIIIDDLGNHPYLDRNALDLPGQVTYAVLPQLGYSDRVSRMIREEGKEVMLHLPMQALNGEPMGPGGLCSDLGREDLAERMRQNLASVPGAVGVNNHMGSLLTKDRRLMGWVMDELKAHGDLYFVDSRTGGYSVAENVAREAGIASARRDVFLDNDPDPAAIRGRFAQLLNIARQRGSAIGIAHPYPTTLDILAEELPRLAEQGVRLVPVSHLIAEQRRAKSWPESSSPLPKVVKNSKR